MNWRKRSIHLLKVALGVQLLQTWRSHSNCRRGIRLIHEDRMEISKMPGNLVMQVSSPVVKLGNSVSAGDGCSEYVSLEELAPLSMSDEDAPSDRSYRKLSALQGNGINVSGSLGMEGTARDELESSSTSRRFLSPFFCK